MFSLLNEESFLYVFFKTSVPLISSEPTFSKETRGCSFGCKDLYRADPNSAKSARLSSLHSMFAPKSKTTFIPFLFGHKPARAGLLTSLIIFNIILDITRRTPVFPADKLISDSWSS